MPLLLLSAFLGIGITVLSSLIPAWSAARITPIDAIRPAMGEVTLRRMLGWTFWAGIVLLVIAVVTLQVKDAAVIGITRFFAIVGMILLAPVLVIPLARMLAGLYAKLAQKSALRERAGENISRLPGRAAITASVTMISLMVLVMVSTIVLSAALGFEKVLRKSLGSDYVLLPPVIALWGTNVGADESLAESLRQIPGVATVSGLRYAPSELKDEPVSVLGIDPANYTKVSGLSFVEGTDAKAYAAIEQPGKAIVNGVMAGLLNVKMGETITLDTPNGAKKYQIVGVGNDYLNAKLATVYLSYATLAADFNRTEDVLVQLSLSPGADAQQVEGAVKAAMKDYPQFQLINGKEYIDENLRILNAAMIGLYFMLAFLAIPGLLAMLNTLSIGVIERTREIGMMRAVGATRRQVSSVITAEGIILGAIGTVFGLAVGLFMGYNGTQMLVDMGFPMEYTFPWAAVLVTVLVGVGFGWIAAIVPARQASRLNVVEALRYE
ncbi:MAG TPA: FtsX-like permease family protein [Bellilinea sp.]|nr:FtsX-like permease family protein [Bellilinea sp.]